MPPLQSRAWAARGGHKIVPRWLSVKRPNAFSVSCRFFDREHAPPLAPSLLTILTAIPRRALHARSRATAPTQRPWWLPIFEEVDPSNRYAVVRAGGTGRVRGYGGTVKDGDGNGSDESASTPLPPWPVDEIEFNARLEDGGHGQRIADEQQQQQREDVRDVYSPYGDSDGREGETDGITGDAAGSRPMQIVPLPLTDAQRAAIATAATATDEGRRAISSGGWLCAQCLTPMPYRSRSVCDSCHTLRHDAEDTVRGWRSDAANWLCADCHEFNFPRDSVCRCCASPRSIANEVRVVHHEGVADEVRHARIGTVVNTRNRVCRWQCPACEEVNSLQCSMCRNCRHERFGLRVSCPTCAHTQILSNKQLYGSEKADEVHALRTFGTHNFFPRLAPTLACAHCSNLLHGASVLTLSRAAWLCGCGNLNVSQYVSCMRCRLPRVVPSTEALRSLCGTATASPSTAVSTPTSLSSSSLPWRGDTQRSARGTWDFATCTNWLCYTCEAVNHASRYVVSLGPNKSTITTAAANAHEVSGLNKAARTVRGDVECRSCQTPWHHQTLQDGQCWRCACHMINQQRDSRCGACGLPARDDVRVDVLSWWTRGDWLCAECGRHNYRDRVECVCNAARPKP